MTYSNTLIAAAVSSFLLSACGSSSSSSAPTNTPSTDLLPPAVVDVVPVETFEERDQASVIAATDDINAGGYVGSMGPLRSTITFPETVEGFKFGVVTRSDSFGLEAGAVFGSFNTARRLFEYMSDFNRPLDSCQQVNLTAFNGFAEKFSPPFAGFTFVSAGEVLPLFSPAGSIGELHDNGSSYRVDSASEMNVPSGEYELSISIPGDEFPGFETMAFPEAARLVGFSSNGGTRFLDLGAPFNPAITPTLVWEPSDDADTYLHLEFGADIPGIDGGSQGQNSFTIHCSLQDDGEYTFPSQIVDLYPREPFNALMRFAARLKVKQVRQTGGTLLLVNIQEHR